MARRSQPRKPVRRSELAHARAADPARRRRRRRSSARRRGTARRRARRRAATRARSPAALDQHRRHALRAELRRELAEMNAAVLRRGQPPDLGAGRDQCALGLRRRARGGRDDRARGGRRRAPAAAARVAACAARCRATTRIGSRAARHARGQPRIVGEHGADADQHRVVRDRAARGTSPRATSPVIHFDSPPTVAILPSSVIAAFSVNAGRPSRAHGEERPIRARRTLGEHGAVHVDARRARSAAIAAAMAGDRIVATDDDARHARRDHRRRARRRAPVVRARLERDVQRRARRARPRAYRARRLGVRRARRRGARPRRSPCRARRRSRSRRSDSARSGRA